jgi:hypothetical protein
MIRAACSCGKLYSVKDQSAGRTLRRRSCGKRFVAGRSPLARRLAASRPSKSGLVTAVGVVTLVFGALGFLLGVLILAAGAAVVGMQTERSDIETIGRSGLAGLIMVVAIVLMVLSVPSIVGGLGILNRRFWARVVVIALGFFSILGAVLALVGKNYIGASTNLAYGAFVLAVLLQPRYGAEFRKRL